MLSNWFTCVNEFHRHRRHVDSVELIVGWWIWGKWKKSHSSGSVTKFLASLSVEKLLAKSWNFLASICWRITDNSNVFSSCLTLWSPLFCFSRQSILMRCRFQLRHRFNQISSSPSSFSFLHLLLRHGLLRYFYLILKFLSRKSNHLPGRREEMPRRRRSSVVLSYKKWEQHVLDRLCEARLGVIHFTPFHRSEVLKNGRWMWGQEKKMKEEIQIFSDKTVCSKEDSKPVVIVSTTSVVRALSLNFFLISDSLLFCCCHWHQTCLNKTSSRLLQLLYENDITQKLFNLMMERRQTRERER